MTLGNDPQPLTRRQLREMARSQAPESGDAATETDPDVEFEPSRPSTTPASTTQPSAFAPRTAPRSDDGAGQADGSDEPARERTTVPERTLTRRELRELMAARQAETGVAPDADVVPSGFVIDEDVIDDDIPEDALDDNTSEVDLSRGAPPVDTDAGEDTEYGSPIQRGVIPAGAGDDQPAAPALSLPPQTLGSPLNPPVGHWSIDRDVDEHTQVTGQNQPFDQLLSRGVAAGGIPTTTNALILPSIPQQGNPSGSMTSTGEILITGSIDLPRSLGSTGQHPSHFDSSEMDHLLDPLDETGPTAGVAPVSASRAVSTHTSTRGVMTPPTKRVASLPVILAVTAGVLLVGVLALFAAGYLFQIF
ncbi:hypothetical protein [Glaciibacter sp. 2TAF33]|uniref:hypothetical protein n=1 Tax=Glaciibacter sp. 2TAF33 TaxID=3233015 RepID=UPI003F8DAC05